MATDPASSTHGLVTLRRVKTEHAFGAGKMQPYGLDKRNKPDSSAGLRPGQDEGTHSSKGFAISSTHGHVTPQKAGNRFRVKT